MNGSQLMSALKAAIKPLENRIRAVASRTTITRIDDSGVSQTVQITVLPGERVPESVAAQNFGLSANPPAGSVSLLISIGGSRTHCVVIGADHESRPRGLAPGESQLYNQWGDFVFLQESGETLVKARSKLIVDAPLIHALGDVEIDGDMLIHGSLLVEGDATIEGETSLEGAVTAASSIAAAGAISSSTSIADPTGTMAAIRVTYNGHKHITDGHTSSTPDAEMDDGSGGGDDGGDGPGGPGGGGGGGDGPIP